MKARRIHLSFRTVIVIFVLFLSQVFPLLAKGSMISGYVFDEYTKEPFFYVPIYLNDKETVFTKKNGYFEITNLEPGKYTIEVRMMGYYMSKQEFSIGSDRNEELNIYLKYGPQFSTSAKYQNYHLQIKTLVNNDSSIFKIIPVAIDTSDSNSISIEFEFVNSSRLSIFVTRFNFRCFFINSSGERIYIPQFIQGDLSFWYEKDDVIEVENGKVFTQCCYIPLYEEYLMSSMKWDPSIFIEYHFNIEEPVCTISEIYPQFPSGKELEALEDIYTKLLRIDVISDPINIDHFIH